MILQFFPIFLFLLSSLIFTLPVWSAVRHYLELMHLLSSRNPPAHQSMQDILGVWEWKCACIGAQGHWQNPPFLFKISFPFTNISIFIGDWVWFSSSTQYFLFFFLSHMKRLQGIFRQVYPKHTGQAGRIHVVCKGSFLMVTSVELVCSDTDFLHVFGRVSSHLHSIKWYLNIFVLCSLSL